MVTPRRAPYAGVIRIRFQGFFSTPSHSARRTPGGSRNIARRGQRHKKARASMPAPSQSAFSSFSLMLTKLYGGQGPEYLNDSSSSYLRLVSFTRSSKTTSDARSTRKAAFRIILSPIGLFDRLATATGLSAS